MNLIKKIFDDKLIIEGQLRDHLLLLRIVQQFDLIDLKNVDEFY